MIKKDVFKGYLGLWVVALSILSMCTSNNSRVPYIDRLLGVLNIPVWSNGGIRTHYSAIIVIVLFFLGYVMLAVYGKYVHKFFHNHTFLSIILIGAVIINVHNGTIRMIKRFSAGVDSIYCYKQKANVSYK